MPQVAAKHAFDDQVLKVHCRYVTKHVLSQKAVDAISEAARVSCENAKCRLYGAESMTRNDAGR